MHYVTNILNRDIIHFFNRCAAPQSLQKHAWGGSLRSLYGAVSRLDGKRFMC